MPRNVWFKLDIGTFFNKRAILLRFLADMTGDEPQSIFTVLFFMRLRMDIW